MPNMGDSCKSHTVTMTAAGAAGAHFARTETCHRCLGMGGDRVRLLLLLLLDSTPVAMGIQVTALNAAESAEGALSLDLFLPAGSYLKLL